MSELKFRGVSEHKDGGFVAAIGYQGKRVYLGIFRSFDEAKEARLNAEVRLFGAHFDRREVRIQTGHAEVPLHGRGGAFHGWAIVDIADVGKVRDIAWTLDLRGYVVGRPPGFKNSTTLHRWLMFDGAKGKEVVDHIDGNRLNNRQCNLRACTAAENAKNTRLARNNTSGAKGVSLDVNGKWRARIWKDRKEIRIGTFDTIEEARAAYDKAAAELHGEFASPNSQLMANKRYSATPGVSVFVVPMEGGA